MFIINISKEMQRWKKIMADDKGLSKDPSSPLPPPPLGQQIKKILVDRREQAKSLSL